MYMVSSRGLMCNLRKGRNTLKGVSCLGEMIWLVRMQMVVVPAKTKISVSGYTTRIVLTEEVGKPCELDHRTDQTSTSE